MEIGFARPRNCERAREWASLQLDQELSEFERALLAAHLRRCEVCGGFQARVAGFTASLRAAPLERLGRPIVLPRRRSGSGGPLRLAVAAAAALALALGTAAGFVASEQPRTRSPFGLRPSYLDYPANQFRLTHQNDRSPDYAARAL